MKRGQKHLLWIQRLVLISATTGTNCVVTRHINITLVIESQCTKNASLDKDLLGDRVELILQMIVSSYIL